MGPILVDDRIGSRELAPYIPDSIVVRLDAGDVEWEGRGSEGDVRCGVERKKVGELITSIRTGRLMGYQLPRMCEEYDVTYLVIEGMWRQGENNGIEVWKKGRWKEAPSGRLGWTALHGILHTAEVMWGVKVKTTAGVRETAELVRILAKWWGKPWEGHKAHRIIYTGARAKVELGEGNVSVLRKVASVLPGIGVDRSKEVERYFGTIKKMCEADEGEWRKVKGIGKVTAKMVVDIIKGGG